MGIPECQECSEYQERQTDTKCHTFSEPQAWGDLNDDGNFRNGRDFRISGMSGMSGMLRISGILEQT